jgi:hypothetical protein
VVTIVTRVSGFFESHETAVDIGGAGILRKFVGVMPSSVPLPLLLVLPSVRSFPRQKGVSINIYSGIFRPSLIEFLSNATRHTLFQIFFLSWRREEQHWEGYYVTMGKL